MIKNIKYKALCLVIALSFASCNKWLDLRPQDGIIKQNYWKTKEQIQASVAGCYASLLNPALVQSFFDWGELRADMVDLTATASIDQVNISQANILPSNLITKWGVVYQTINYCNTVIDFAPGVLENDKTLTQVQLDAYLSEAYTLRALMYFNLLRAFGEVPLQLIASSSDDKIVQLPKSSKEDVYKQIISDLDFASKNAVLTYGNQNMDKGRVTKYTVFAIQADAYLWMDNYDECIKACDKIINSNQFGLINGLFQSTWFDALYFTGNSAESIFEFQFDVQKLPPFNAMFADSKKKYTSSAFVPDVLFGQDPDPLLRDIRANYGSFRSADLVLWKYVGNSTLALRAPADSYSHWFVYRYADILLMKAEACAWNSREAEALALVNTIRDRAGAINFNKETPITTLDLSNYILKERAREFAFEGKRWYDVLRNAKRNNYANISLMIDMVTADAPSDRQQTIISKYKDVRSWYLPINDIELTSNKNLIQNPFYK